MTLNIFYLDRLGGLYLIGFEGLSRGHESKWSPFGPATAQLNYNFYYSSAPLWKLSVFERRLPLLHLVIWKWIQIIGVEARTWKIRIKNKERVTSASLVGEQEARVMKTRSQLFYTFFNNIFTFFRMKCLIWMSIYRQVHLPGQRCAFVKFDSVKVFRDWIKCTFPFRAIIWRCWNVKK